MSNIAKELFKAIVTATASQEDFSSAIKQKMDQAMDVRKAGITAGIYNQQSSVSSETFEESTDLKEVKDKLLGAAYKALDNAYSWYQVDTSEDSEIVFYWPAEENDQKGGANRNSQPGDLAMYVNKNGTVSGDIPKDRVVQKALDKLRFKKEGVNKNQLLVKDLEKLIKNPDPSRVKKYGGTKYVDMLKSKLAKLQTESIEEAIKWWTVTITKKTGKLLKGQTVDVKASNPAQAIKKGIKQMKADPMTVPSDSVNVVLGESIEEASSGDVEKILKFAAKNGAKRKGNVADFGGSEIEFSLDKGKIKFDGGKDSVEYFDNLRDAISALSIGMED
jgi:hypothetical protein